jgi:ABC-type glycerol-3-phosphate transport system substrate-binding protein
MTRRPLRRVSRLAAALAAATLAVAATTAGAARHAGVSGQITVLCWTSTIDALKIADQGFSKAFPDVQVNYVVKKPSDVYQTLQLDSAAGGGFPDVSCIEDSHLAQFVKLGVLSDLTARLKPYVPKILAYKWNEVQAGGHYYAMPWDAGPMAVFYRRSIFKKAGINPASIETWDDYYKAALKLKRLGVPIWLQSKAQNDARFFEGLLWQQGTGYVDAKGNVVLDKDPRVLQTLLYLGKLWKAGVLGDLQEWTDPWYNAINGGQVATLPMAVWMGTFLKSWLAPKTAGDWGVFPLPSWGPGGAHSSNDGGSALAAFKASKNQDAAWAYIQYHLGRADTQANIYRQTDIFPALETSWRSPYMREADPYYGNEKVRQLFVTAAKQIPVAHVYTSDYEQMNALLSTEIQKYALGQETAQQALKNAANAIRSRTGRH